MSERNNLFLAYAQNKSLGLRVIGQKNSELNTCEVLDLG